MRSGLCNRRAGPRSARTTIVVLPVLLCLLGSCQSAPRAATVGPDLLRTARPVPLRRLARAEVSGGRLPAGLAVPLTGRLWLIELRTPGQWRRLRAIAPGIGDCPDLRRGVVFGLLLRCGQPLSGRWPLALRTARVAGGAALLEGRVAGGSFLLDTTGYLTLVQVPGAHYAAVLDLGDQRFYPLAVGD